MDDLSAAIFSAWAEHGPRILADRAELRRRLARRHLKVLRRPMRAWCLAVRASDQRINPATACVVPEAAGYPRSHAHPHHVPDEHEVTLDARLLREVCRPVRIEWPGEDWKYAAKQLGFSKSTLASAIRLGKFKVRRVKGLQGQIGKPIPIVYCEHLLDPSSGRVGEVPDPVWGSLWQRLAEELPDDFEQTLTRLPRTRPWMGRSVTRGWDWICPRCRKRVNIVYCPMPPISLPEFLGLKDDRGRVIRPRRERGEFACVRCHGVRHFSRVDKNSWNELIHHLSGGLLYGYEVKRPAWLTPDRKKRFVKMVRRQPSVRRAQVLARLLKGWTDRRIATDLGISYHRTRNHVAIVLREHGAHSRLELIARMSKLDPARRDRARAATRHVSPQRPTPRLTPARPRQLN
jgi:DNA-binding CsgD family transcriptional regulator